MSKDIRRFQGSNFRLGDESYWHPARFQGSFVFLWREWGQFAPFTFNQHKRCMRNVYRCSRSLRKLKFYVQPYEIQELLFICSQQLRLKSVEWTIWLMNCKGRGRKLSCRGLRCLVGLTYLRSLVWTRMQDFNNSAAKFSRYSHDHKTKISDPSSIQIEELCRKVSDPLRPKQTPWWRRGFVWMSLQLQLFTLHSVTHRYWGWGEGGADLY